MPRTSPLDVVSSIVSCDGGGMNGANVPHGFKQWGKGAESTFPISFAYFALNLI